MLQQGFLRRGTLWLLFCLAFLAIPLLSHTKGVKAEEATVDAIEQVQAVSPLAPPNDQFGKATKITSLPFNVNSDLTYASLQKNEPRASCSYNYPTFDKSIWYAYTATKNGSLLATLSANYGSVNSLAIYTGGGLAGLSEARCAIRYYYYDTTYLSFAAKAGTTYYFQLALVEGQAGPVSFGLQVMPPPQVSINYYGYNGTSIYDTIQFQANVNDPYGGGNISYVYTWSFGDGSTATDYYTYHQYAKDGDYTVQLTVTTSDGRSATASTIVAVRTHDVAIVKFARPKTATVGQTKRLVIGVSNTRYPEVVRMNIYKGSPYGNQFIGSWMQDVPVQASGTTDFYFRYTFTSADAALGKVTLIAVAEIQGVNDALSADNTFITFPIIVTPAAANASEVTASSEDDMSDYDTDTVSNVNSTDAQAGNKVFMPFVNN